MLVGLSGKTSTAAEAEIPFVIKNKKLTKGLSSSDAVEVFPERPPNKDKTGVEPAWDKMYNSSTPYFEKKEGGK